MNNKDLIHLQNAHVTQYTYEDGRKSDWSLQMNETNEELFSFPGDWSEEMVFTVLDFARKFELIALNVGINFGAKNIKKEKDIEIEKLIKVINGLEISNTRLANKLSQFIGE